MTFRVGEYHVLDGPRGVLAAVLLQALDDARSRNGSARLARAWFSSDREDDLFDFLCVCDALELDPAAVRRAAGPHPIPHIIRCTSL